MGHKNPRTLCLWILHNCLLCDFQMHDSASGTPQHFTKDFCRSITAETMLTEGNRHVCGSIAVFYMLMKVSSKNNRRFPEITGENNLTVFSSSGRVKSPQLR